MPLDDIVASAWGITETAALTHSADSGATVVADPERLRSLFAAAFEFATHNGATTVTVDTTDDGFTITDDGAPIGDSSPDAYFRYGSAVPDAEAGLTLPNLRMLAETHGWDVTLDTAYQDGIRIVVSRVTTLRTDASGTVSHH